MTPMSNDPAEARKRRKEIIQSQRSENESIANVAAVSASNGLSSSTSASSLTANMINGKNGITGGEKSSNNTTAIDANGNGVDTKPPKKRKVASGDSSTRKNIKKNEADDNSDDDIDDKCKKTQIRYDPEVPMNKDQLAAWRREARRVRNRESAAASRQRIRNRISELEDEVGDWKAKYSNAIQRLEALEKCISANNNINIGGAGQPEQAPEQPQDQQQALQPPIEQPVAQPAAASGASEGTTESTIDI